MKRLLMLAVFVYTVDGNFGSIYTPDYLQGFLNYCHAAGIHLSKRKGDTGQNGNINVAGRTLTINLYEVANPPDTALDPDPILNNWEIYRSTISAACNANNPGGPCL
jgi:hypothetical protein